MMMNWSHRNALMCLCSIKCHELLWWKWHCWHLIVNIITKCVSSQVYNKCQALILRSLSRRLKDVYLHIHFCFFFFVDLIDFFFIECARTIQYSIACRLSDLYTIHSLLSIDKQIAFLSSTELLHTRSSVHSINGVCFGICVCGSFTQYLLANVCARALVMFCKKLTVRSFFVVVVVIVTLKMEWFSLRFSMLICRLSPLPITYISSNEHGKELFFF